MQIVVTVEALIVALAALVLFITGSLLYYQFVYKRERRAKEHLSSLHFRISDFIKDLTPMTFEFHDRKVTRLGIGGLVLLFISILAPVFLGVPQPFNYFIMVIGLFASIVIVDKANVAIRDKEHRRNENTTYGSAHILFPEPYGEVGLLLRRMKHVKDLELSDSEREMLVDNAVEKIKTLPDYDKMKVDEKNLKREWLERIKRFRVGLFTVADKYWILLIAQNRFADMKTPHTHEMIDETEHVNVQLAPMFLVYVEPTTKVFETVDEDSRTIFTDRKMGVFIDLFDLAKRNEMLIKGESTALSRGDALFAKYLFLYVQNTETAISMTDTETSLEKADKDAEEREFESDVESIKAAAKDLNKSFSDVRSARRSDISLGKWAKVVLVIILIGVAVLVGYYLLPRA